jgi:hypothetical protein
VDGPQQLLRPEHVGGEPLVQRRVERDGPGAVDHHVRLGRHGRHRREVTLQAPDPFGDQGVQRRLAAQPLAQRPERGLAHQVAEALGPGPPAAGTDDGEDAGVGEVGQDPLQQRLADEAGDPREQQGATGEPLRDRGRRGPRRFVVVRHGSPPGGRLRKSAARNRVGAGAVARPLRRVTCPPRRAQRQVTAWIANITAM